MRVRSRLPQCRIAPPAPAYSERHPRCPLPCLHLRPTGGSGVVCNESEGRFCPVETEQVRCRPGAIAVTRVGTSPRASALRSSRCLPRSYMRRLRPIPASRRPLKPVRTAGRSSTDERWRNCGRDAARMPVAVGCPAGTSGSLPVASAGTSPIRSSRYLRSHAAARARARVPRHARDCYPPQIPSRRGAQRGALPAIRLPRGLRALPDGVSRGGASTGPARCRQPQRQRELPGGWPSPHAPAPAGDDAPGAHEPPIHTHSLWIRFSVGYGPV